MTITEDETLSRVLGGPTPFPPDAAPDGIGVIVINRTTRLTAADAGLLAMLQPDAPGTASDPAGVSAWSLLRRVHHTDRRLLLAAIARLTGPRRERFRAYLGPERAERWLEARLDVDLLDPAHVTAIIIDVHDLVTDNLNLTVEKAKLEASDRHHRAVLAATPDAIHIYDVRTGTIARATQSALPLVDFTPEAAAVVAGEGVEHYVPPADRVQWSKTLRRAAALPDGQTEFIRHRVIAADGQTCWLRRRLGVLTRDDTGAATSLLIASREVTDLVTVEQRLEHAATHDEATGVANRRKFLTEVDEGLRQGKHVAIAVLDLEGLRSVSDSRGREVTEAVLFSVARRLRAAVRATDVVARLGDTEFGLLVRGDRRTAPGAGSSAGAAAPAQIDQVVERIEDLLTEPLHLGDIQLGLTASIGICVDSLASADAMLKAAHAAIDKLRGSGAGGHYTYDQALEEEIRSTEHIERNLRRALAENALEVYYQPIVMRRTGRVCAVEALMRLRDESGQLLPVEQVIAVAERRDLVAELDDQILAKASRQVAAWRRIERYADLRLTLNRSAKDLNRPGFYHRIMRQLATSGLPCEALTLEITETVLLHEASMRMDEMAHLRDQSIGLAIDDFGTGYASLSQLISLPLSVMKIDRSFTARMLQDSACAALVAASVRIAADLHLACVVEGVETMEQLHALPDYDRLMVQGYLYGRPRPAGPEGPEVAALRT